jgi:hypothetical protein
MGRESMNLRVQLFEIDSAFHLGTDGMIDPAGGIRGGRNPRSS